MMRSGDKKQSPWYKILMFGLESIGKYYSVYPGFVVDNNDPDRRNRIKIMCPSVEGFTMNPTWAEPIGIWGGRDYGIQMLPQQGEVVWVSYRNGNPGFPLWQFAPSPKSDDNGKGMPEEFEHQFVYGLKTPRGNVVLINDSEDGEGDSYIEIIHHENGKIRIEEAKILLESGEIKLLATDLVELGDNANESAVKGDTAAAHIKSILTNIASSGVYMGTAFLPLWNATTFTTLQSQTDNIKSNKVKVE